MGGNSITSENLTQNLTEYPAEFSTKIQMTEMQKGTFLALHFLS